MFLRNYYNLMARASLAYSKILSEDSGYGDNSLLIKDYYGGLLTNLTYNTHYENTVPDILGKVMTTSLNNSCGIILGSGNEPVTFNDYRLANYISSNRFKSSKVSTDNIVYNEQEHKFYSKSKYTLSNVDSVELIISEYGIYLYNHNPYLIFRDLIEPYALQPSESVNVILNASYTMPTIDESGNVVAGSQAYGLNIE